MFALCTLLILFHCFTLASHSSGISDRTFILARTSSPLFVSCVEVEFKEWEKMDLRVAQIKKVEDIPGADKLYKLSIDVGELGVRIICAGLKEFYTKDRLKSKKIIYFANLKPRMMKGIESQGMLLAASTEDHKKVSLILPDSEVENGSRIG